MTCKTNQQIDVRTWVVLALFLQQKSIMSLWRKPGFFMTKHAIYKFRNEDNSLMEHSGTRCGFIIFLNLLLA